MTLTLDYSSQDIAGLYYKKLTIAYYDPVLIKWVTVPSTVNAQSMQLTAGINKFAIYAVVESMAPSNDLGSVVAYPNPYNPRKSAGITITNLTATADIKIYNAAGQLIRTLNYSGNGQTTWDGRNDSGAMAASGVYLININCPKVSRIVKVAVEK